MTDAGTPRPPPDALFLGPRRRLAAWKAIGASPRALRAIDKGAALTFWRHPRPYQSRPIPVADGDRDWLAEEISKNLQRGSWVRAPAVPAYCAPAFVATNTNTGKRRVVIDLRLINRHLRFAGARYETLQALRAMARRDDWMLSLDLEAGYHHIGIRPRDVQYLGFQIGGQYFYCTALPFGLASAPLIFTKVMRACVAHWRRDGTRVLPYLDDFLFLFDSTGKARRGAAEIDHLLQSLGLRRNISKGCWEPTQNLVHLGIGVSTTDLRFYAPAQKEARVRAFAARIVITASRRTRMCSVSPLLSFTGLCQSLALAVPEVHLRTRAIYDSVRSAATGGRARLSRSALGELAWWRDAPWNAGAHIDLPTPTMDLFTDASDIGWGAVLDGSETRGYWSLLQRSSSIFERELLAVLLALRSWPERLRGHHIRLHIDNQAAAFSLIKLGSRHPAARFIVEQIWQDCRALGVRLWVQWIPTHANGDADRLSRFVDRSDYKANPRIFELAASLWGRPDIDAFATTLNTQLPVFWSARPGMGAAAVDALAQDLSGLFLWANPPWDLIPALLHRIRLYPTARVTLVLPHWQSASWYPELLDLQPELRVLPPQVDSFLPGWQSSIQPIGPPHWSILLAHIRPRPL